MTTTYGLIGLGNVGGDLVRNAVSRGIAPVVHDLDRAAVERAVAAGAVAADGAQQLAAAADVLVLSLPNSDIVDAVLADGVLSALRPGAVLVDMSTNLPERAVGLAEEGRSRGLRVLDAPVTYGPDGLVAYVGGDLDGAPEAAAWLDAAVTQWFPIGPSGRGQSMKLVQNMLSGVGMGIVAEVLAFARASGLDPDAVLPALRPTGAYSGLVERTLPAMAAARYGDAGTMALHAKDMGYALRAAEQAGIELPFTAVLRGLFGDVLARGDRRWGQTALIEWWASEPSAATGAEATA